MSLTMFLHGFSQTPLMWKRVLAGLPPLQVSTPWIAGHGVQASPTSFMDEVRRLAALDEPTHLVGYSLGGRLALAMALQMPSVQRLTLIGATAGIRDSLDLSDRQRWDQAQAAIIRREGVTDFLQGWGRNLTLRVFRECEPVMENLVAQKEHRVEGLATAMVVLGRGRMPPLWDKLPNLKIPVDVVFGDRDLSHRKLAKEMADALPNATLHAIKGCGHNAVLEAPDEIVDIIRGPL